MDTTLFYFFSTIAQVIGAIVALTGVFAIFKIRLLKEDIGGHSQVFYNSFKSALVSCTMGNRVVDITDVSISVENDEELSKLRSVKISRDYPTLLRKCTGC